MLLIVTPELISQMKQLVLKNTTQGKNICGNIGAGSILLLFKKLKLMTCFHQFNLLVFSFAAEAVGFVFNLVSTESRS